MSEEVSSSPETMSSSATTIACSLALVVIVSSICVLYCTREARIKWFLLVCCCGEDYYAIPGRQNASPGGQVDDRENDVRLIQQTRALLKVWLAPYTKMLEATDIEQPQADDESGLNDRSGLGKDITTPQQTQTTDEESAIRFPAVDFGKGGALNKDTCLDTDEELGAVSNADGDDVEESLSQTITDEELAAVPNRDGDGDEEPSTLSSCERPAEKTTCDGTPQQDNSLEADEGLGIETFHSAVTVPMPGNQHIYALDIRGGGNSSCQRNLSSRGLPLRKVPNQCSICLGAYETGDDVTWSSNSNCQHVFHHDCIFDWLERSFQQYLAKSQRSRTTIDNAFAAMTCPCCRQAFVDNSRLQERSVESARQDRSIAIPSGDGSTTPSEIVESVRTNEVDP